MRRITYLAALVLMILGSSCATLSVTEIRKLDRVKFDPIRLNPDFETNDFRIDVIRCTESDTSSSHDVPYLPLGFDLGNGLFYDLNQNLSLRIDYLMGLTGKDCYEISRFDHKSRKRPDYTFNFCRDTLSMRGRWNRKQRYVCHRVTEGPKITVMRHKQLQYTIELNNQTATYGGKKRAWETINREDQNNYYLNRNKKRNRYELKENRVFLENDYIIELTDNDRRLNIISPGLLRDHCLYSIERSKDHLYIYDQGNSGKKITFTENGITIYHNKSFANRWENSHLPDQSR